MGEADGLMRGDVVFFQWEIFHGGLIISAATDCYVDVILTSFTSHSIKASLKIMLQDFKSKTSDGLFYNVVIGQSINPSILGHIGGQNQSISRHQDVDFRSILIG